MKHFISLIAMTVLAIAVQASTLTICGGEYYSGVLPIHGIWADTEGTTGQMIYPSDMLTDMKDSYINELEFCTIANYFLSQDLDVPDSYGSAAYINFEGATLQLSLMETDQNGFTEKVAITGAKVVSTTISPKGSSTLTFVLDEPFEYKGGNLLVEVKVIEGGTYGTTYFWGEAFDLNYSFYYYNSYDGFVSNTSPFLPRVTFSFSKGLDYSFNSYGWGTFYYSNATYLVPEGVSAYIVSDASENSVTLTETSIIPAGTAVILNGEADKTYTFSETLEATSSLGENLLAGTDEDTDILASEEGKYYVLSIKNNKLGFYYGSTDGGGFTNLAHRAYLYLPNENIASNSNFVSLFESTTGIRHNVDMTESDIPAYNLSGQRVDKSHKGIVIINGKKILNK